MIDGNLGADQYIKGGGGDGVVIVKKPRPALSIGVTI